MNLSTKLFFVAGLTLGATTAGHAAIATADQPDLDRWAYPFAGSGTGTIGAVFGAVGDDGFDDRDGQFLVGFDTTAIGVPTGQGGGNYRINSVTVTATQFNGQAYDYDPSYDSYQTYLDAEDDDYTADTDAGRPIELHGIGFRGGYQSLNFGATDTDDTTFDETNAFGDNGATPFAPDERDRNVYPITFDTAGNPTDVSNNVAEGFESDPWAVGTNSSLTAGQGVPADTTFTFELDLTDPDILAYLQAGLEAGQLGFVITSLHPASKGGAPAYPRLYTREASDGFPATLSIDYDVVPEPGSLALLGCGGAALLIRRRRGRRATRA